MGLPECVEVYLSVWRFTCVCVGLPECVEVYLSVCAFT